VAAPERKFFLIPPGEYEIRDLVYSRMQATGSKTIVSHDVFVPNARALSLSNLEMERGRVAR
jgi:hypothetical protein